MWLLSCDDELFGGKRLWLRPGSTHLLGRTSGKPAGGERVQFINHKSVSRKHLVLQISQVVPGSSTQIHVKSQVEVIDNSKTGTTINGEKLVKATKILQGGLFLIKLGNYGTTFQLQWRPAILTFTNVPSSTERRAEVMAAHTKRLEHFDVKLVTDYIVNQTTHVIAKKRNTAAGLEALVQGKWLITDKWIDALAAACNNDSAGGAGDPPYSLLESDFEANWPRELPFVVPAGGEPIPRENSLLEPDPRRANVFDGFTFVFLSRTQYASLLSVVTSASGKALHYEYITDTTTPNDVVSFVQNLAATPNGNQSQKRGESFMSNVVVVRIGEKEEGRSKSLLHHIDIALNQRSIEQNEFLDAILMNDAGGLYRQLQEETIPPPDTSDPERSQGTPSDQLQSNSKATSYQDRPEKGTINERADLHQAEQPLKLEERRRRRRAVVEPRFAGFDDFDPSQVIRSSASPKRHGDDTLLATSSRNEDLEAPLRIAANAKRPASGMDMEEETKRELDKLFPGAAAMKRRRIDRPAQDAARSAEPSKAAAPASATSHTNQAKAMSGAALKAKLKARMDREEELRRLDEESLKQALDVDLDSLGDVAKIEFFELPIRPAERPRNCHDSSHYSRGWKSAWDGRPNYKRFRTQGSDRIGALELPRVTVTLEEVSSRNHGLNEFYLHEASAPSRHSQPDRRGGTQSTMTSSASAKDTNKTRHQILGDRGSLDEDEESTRFQRQIKITCQEDAEAISLDELIHDGSRDSGHAVQSVSTYHHTPPLSSTSHGKRPAADQSLQTGSAKRISRSRPAVFDASDEDDPLKFRRKRR